VLIQEGLSNLPNRKQETKMTEHLISSVRRILVLSAVTYIVLPLLPGVTFTGNILTAMGFGTMLFVAAVVDLILIALAMWWLSLVSLGNFVIDFKMESKSAFAPLFVVALVLAELSTIARKIGVLSFDGWLPMATSALILALAAWLVCLKFDTFLFDLNVDRQGSRPRGGKKLRVRVPVQTR
jgi:hypothetical protein